MNVLETRDLVKSYRGRTVVNKVNLTVRSGEITGLLGPNGAGKTTTFYMMVGLIKPDSGQVLFDNKDITDLPMYLRARLGITYLPQEPSVFRKLTVSENIMAILETLKLSESARKERLKELLEELNISQLADSKAYELSGGERRRVEITRCLVISPYFMLLDEPFAGIDPLAVIDIQNIIRKLKEKGIGIIVSDHNVRETLKVCDRAYVMHQGEILEEGSPEKIANSTVARRFYLGDEFSLGV
ncbi:MAG TPA: LPS export ABC transporter ATP-binding protein [Deltaproteobacteria bacterium]|nr:MAG: LPS export ABC transporter ATP-binding protein [Deltaproteobacteria bacterium]HEC32501.1 LPS export ABC transporter ATP-binding protein [Deltaproteobacteria bacterium]